jgi:hypothetical protein
MKASSLSFAVVFMAAALGFSAADAARAAEADYLDDRSDAGALVHSLYNAINRQEYGRAWSYFGDAKPAKDFDTFVNGYANTQRVDIETGDVSSDGAAGSIYYEVPAAIRAVGKDGGEHVFAGCYTVRLANPQIQGESFQPMHIEKGVLKPAQGELADAVPPSCGEGPAPDKKDSALEQARKVFAGAYAPICQTLARDAEPDAAKGEAFEIEFNYKYESTGDPLRKARLFKFPCGYGAYNSTEVYYLTGDAGEIRQLQFAEPELDIRYENDDAEGKVEQINVIGYRVRDQLVNSSYDPDALSLTSSAKWRGAGDASSSGKWIFRDGAFTLVRYDVDASYDGEVNTETVIDYDTAP